MYQRRNDNDRPALHAATCSACKKACEVPFKPTGSKPVLCRDCFNKEGGRDRRPASRDRRPSGDRRPGGPNYRAQLEALNRKLDKILEIITPEVTGERVKVEGFATDRAKKDVDHDALDEAVSKAMEGREE